MSIPSIIKRLRANNEDFKQLILTADEIGLQENQEQPEDPNDETRATSKNIDILAEAIQSNQTVQSVFLDHFFVRNLSREEICKLFTAIGSLPRLEQLSALSRQAEGWSIPMHAMSCFMDQTKALSSLRLSSIGLVGTVEDFTNFAKSIQSQSFMKEFCLRGACIVDGRIPLDNLLRSLSAVPLLEKIELTAMDLHQDLGGEWPNSPSSALRFCQSSSLKSLELGGWVLDEDLVLKMASALETNHSLRSLIMLDSNITNKGCVALSKMLAVNKTIERLDLSYNRISDPGCSALANSLTFNTSLKEIGLFGNFQVRSRDMFLRIVEQSNFTLEDLLLDSEWDAEMNFYLNLNRVNRRGVLQNEGLTRREWVHALVNVQDEKNCLLDAPQETLSYLFYFIMAKPHFVLATVTQGE
ncbi:Leucine-rich repeat protein [Seminavis robusta]|uniref:Leucine-rich repeat protein n=1 Tax=Seminavis robusta TaxID=568900 RepID=A0A9N8H5T3_9STRA|nr:Leucine-rich repeat protein [Seminavis robusta]|eukprot:Sro94_g049040.1 Leucine-rich repeat protein (413) ;mRNA; r:74419-75657